MTENNKKYFYLFGIFFDKNEYALSDYEVLDLLNRMDKEIKLQEDLLDKIVNHLGYDDRIDLIKEINGEINED